MLSAEVVAMHSVTVRMNDHEYDLLDGIAKANHKSRAAIMREALEKQVEHEDFKKKAIAEGRRAMESGDVVGHDHVLNHMQRIKDKHGL